MQGDWESAKLHKYYKQAKLFQDGQQWQECVHSQKAS